MSAGSEKELLSFRPGAWYYRQAVRELKDPDALKELAEILIEELEEHRRFIRAAGQWPPVKYDPAAVARDLLGRPLDDSDHNQLALALLDDPPSGRAG